MANEESKTLSLLARLTVARSRFMDLMDLKMKRLRVTYAFFTFLQTLGQWFITLYAMAYK